jgi:hypothetical protein
VDTWAFEEVLDHCGASEEKIPSASAIKGVIGHLAKSYAMKGRKDTENLAKEESVINYRDRYRNTLHDRGVREKRARVMKEGKVLDLVEYLIRLANEAVGLPKVVLLMDRAAVLYLWDSWARGKEAGEPEERQIDREDGIDLPGWSKTVQSEPSGPVELAKESPEMTFLAGSAELLAEMEAQKIDLGKGFLFRPLTTNRKGFKDKPLKSGTLKKRVQVHMTKADLFEGESLHNFRRPAVQHAAKIEGYDVTKLMQRGRWKSYTAFRLYVEEIEHRFGRRKPGSEGQVILYTAKPRSARFSVLAGTVGLANKLWTALGIVNGSETIAPFNWLICILSFEAEPPGIATNADIACCSMRLRVRLTALTGGSTHAVPPCTNSAQSCRKASTAVQPDMNTLLMNIGTR